MEEQISSAHLKQPDLNLRHLQAELARVDLLVRYEVRRWQAAGQEPGDAFRGLSISDEEADQLSRRPFGTSWGQTVTLPEEEEAAFSAAYREAGKQIEAIVQLAQDQEMQLSLAYLCDAFNLDRFDLDTLLICLAPALDLRYERLYGFLQDDVTCKRPTVNLILNLLCEPGEDRLLRLARFDETAPLFQHRLINFPADSAADPGNLLSQPLQVDPTLVAWLLGRYSPRPELSAHIQYLRPVEDPSDRLLAASLDGQLNLEELSGSFSQDMPILVFYGPDRAGQEAAARICAARLNRPLLSIDLNAVALRNEPLLSALRLALRDACLIGAIPFFSGWDACLQSGSRPSANEEGDHLRLAVDGGIAGVCLAELCTYPGPIILSSHSVWQAVGVERNTPLFWVEFPIPDYPQRLALWKNFLTSAVPADGMASLDLPALASQFSLTSGQIRDAVTAARDLVAQTRSRMSTRDLFTAARLQSSPYLGGLARKVEPRYTWNDIVLPADQFQMLHEIVSTVRFRPVVLEEWGVGRKLVPSSGVPILFSGPPGTGKTMAAEVVSHELGLDLYKIELSTVVSKYIGETEKNLERIFDEAEQSNAILFFDEADAIFGKRSEVKDAHDRYANVEISYLLQRMEAYGGVTILATNLRANLDEAFTRRLQFSIDFPFPEEDYRLRIWQTLFPPEVPRAENIDFSVLASRFKLAGGNIRNIIVSAAYLAASDGGCVTMSHLLHGVRREMQKMGRLVNEKDLVFAGGEHAR